MNRGVWCTKEDVLKDLEVASGRRVADVSDSFFVVGEQPPPPPMFRDEDDEIELQFGQAAPSHTLTQSDQDGPDLNGITKMLRMVQEYEKSPYEDSKTSEIGTSNKEIIISKLNPNVKEFIPKNYSSLNVTISKDNTKFSNNSSTESTFGSNVKNEKDNDYINDIKAENNTNSDVFEINKEYTKESKKELAQMLRNQISTKKDTFKQKRQASLAIVNLLKLYAKPEDKPEMAKPLKLLTPQFFEKCKAADFQSNLEDTTNSESSIKQKDPLLKEDEIKNVDVVLEQPQNSNLSEKSNCSGAIFKHRPIRGINDGFVVLNKKNIDSNIVDKDKNEILNEATSLTPDMADASVGNKTLPSVVVEKAMDPEIAESITKVSNWLDNKPYVSECEKEKPKGHTMYLGPVVYKRKDPATCKSPSEVADKKILKSTDNAYKPSSYADELLKQYKERSKKPTKPTLNIWEKLEEDLKKKDVEIRKQKGQASYNDDIADN